MPSKLALVGWIFAVPALAWALYASRNEEEETTTLGALLAACLFAAQTFHFPIPGGTSGHLVGACLVMILCGLPLGFLILTSVVLLQAIVFGDGGLFTLGWNLNNMGVVAGFVGASLFSALRRIGSPIFGAAFLSAWTSTMLGALCTALELAFAGVTPLNISLLAMLSVQALTGIGEGLVTAGTLTFFQRTRPSLLKGRAPLIWPGAATYCLVAVATLLPPSLFGLKSADYPAFLALLGISAVAAVLSIVLKLWSRRWPS